MFLLSLFSRDSLFQVEALMRSIQTLGSDFSARLVVSAARWTEVSEEAEVSNRESDSTAELSDTAEPEVSDMAQTELSEVLVADEPSEELRNEKFSIDLVSLSVWSVGWSVRWLVGRSGTVP